MPVRSAAKTDGMDKPLLSGEPRLLTEQTVGRALFSFRWLLAPFYIGLALSLFVLLVKFVQKTAHLVANVFSANSSEVITLVLSLIDISLIASLVLMVMLACYENFVSGFELERYKYKPSWMGHIDFGELKVKLLTSIVAISAIHVLEIFMNIGPASDHELAWSVGILIAFVLSGLLLAVMNRISPGERE